jgi:TIR domain
LITKADTVVFVLSPDSVASNVCRKEVAFAASLNKRFAPIVCRPVDVAVVPQELARLNFIFFEDQTLFEESAATFLRAWNSLASYVVIYLFILKEDKGFSPINFSTMIESFVERVTNQSTAFEARSIIAIK